jgi:hypothetical protein
LNLENTKIKWLIQPLMISLLGEVYKKTHLGPMDIGGDVVTFRVLIFMKIESRGLLQLCKQMIFFEARNE